MIVYQLILLLLMLARSHGNTLGPIKETNKTLIRKLERPINVVLQHVGKEVEDIYDKNLFEISKHYYKINEDKITKLFKYNADLINYIEKHSYLEVIWCFHLSQEMTLWKTFEQIKEMEPKNQFTIYSATGSKPWPSGKNDPRHNVCDTISKQPITSGLYENFLVPARCKSLGIKPIEFDKVKSFFDIEQLATRLEFAQALHIDIVAKRIQPKINDALINKLRKITFASITKQHIKINTIDLKSQSIVSLLASNNKLANHALSVTLKFYTSKPKVINLLNDASFKSVTHLIKNPRPENATFGEIFEHVELALRDLKKNLESPMIIVLDRNHVLSNLVNKTLMNAFITILKEPSDIITSYYQLSPEQRRFLSTTKMSKLRTMLSQNSIRLQHLSIQYLINLIKHQTPINLKTGKIIHNDFDIDKVYVDSVRNILKRTTLGDFLRIYHKAWTKPQLMKKTLLKLAVHQGLTGNEFLQIYGLEKQNISKITLFTNYTLQMLSKKRKHIYYYTFEELGQFVKGDINNTSVAKATYRENHPDNQRVNRDKQKSNIKKDKIERPSDDRKGDTVESRSGGPRPLVVIAPTLFCVFASIAALVGWIYYEKRKAWRSAW